MESPLLSGIAGVRHGFGTLAEPIPAVFAADWESRKVSWKQVHGIAVAEARASGQVCGEVDALFTVRQGIPVGIVTADCVPVLLARRDGGAVAAAHAGWRGTRAHILRALWKELARAGGGKPSEWMAAVGPAIGPCCYEVSEELAEDFGREFGRELAVPRHRHLDLPAINEAELRAIGIGQVEVIRACTQCSAASTGKPRFHSFRREKASTRQWSIIEALAPR